MTLPVLSRLQSLALIVVSSLAVAACAPMHTTQSGAVNVQRAQYMSPLVSAQQLDQEAQRQYAATLKQAKAQKRLDTNPQQLKRIQAISQRLIQQVGVFRPDARNWNWEIHLIDSNEANAWCMPGGKMAVYSGLIKQLNPTDDELAAVIGHEMAHALREHSREQVSQAVASSLGLSVLAAITGSQQTADLGAKLNEVMFRLPNSRGHEQEADRIGVELAARAGYNPRAAVTLWQKMGRLNQGAQPPEFLSTHPSSSSRIADLDKIATQMMPLYESANR